MRFSERTGWELGENGFARLVREVRVNRISLLDLTSANPTVCSFEYDTQSVLSPLGKQDALYYEPDPLGLTLARQAVSTYYADTGAKVPVGHLCLTTSTSEAYSFLFQLLCDAGDEVLVAAPSYPLFDYIARLDDVRLVDYPLLYDDGWLIDFHALEAAIGPRTRAVIVVHPNNPTGHFSKANERAELERICVQRSLSLIVDEVFLDYAVAGRGEHSFTAGDSQALTFVLSGISKICGLPQMKCSWIAVNGTEAEVEAAMERLEIIADTFLSMNAPIQHALGPWLASRNHFQAQVRERVQRNIAVLDGALASTPAERLVLDAGWSCVLRVPRTVRGAPFAEAALAEGVLVQPGESYGLPHGRIVLSLLTPPHVWDEGVERLASLSLI